LQGRSIAIAGSSARSNAGANAQTSGFALQVFGRSIRESNCDCDRSMDASLLQTVYLQNDTTVLQALEGGRDSWIGQLTKKAADKLSDGTKTGNLDFKREIGRMQDRIARAKKDGNDGQAKRLEERLAELEKAAGDKQETAKSPGELAIDEPTFIRQAYLRTLSRNPTPEEVDHCLAFLAESESPIAGAKGLLWTLINTKEFIVNH
jgi:hypothetical protein